MAGRARRVFLSHTSELHDYPVNRSFVAAARDAVIRAGDVLVDMAYFSARESRPAEHCRHVVSMADIYVGIIGMRYGSPVTDRPDLSYTELEFEAATDRGLPRLIFLLDEDAELPLPARWLIDREHAERQHAFRHRLRESGPLVAKLATPAELEARLYQALVELAPTPPVPLRPTVMGGSVMAPLGRLPAEVRGREDLLTSLESQRGVVVLAGMGGIGKSTVAAEIARRMPSDRRVWWIQASDALDLIAGMVTVARQLGANDADLEALAAQAGDAPDRLWTLLEQAADGWLLVFDGADHPEVLAGHRRSVADGTGWVRASRHGLVLVTSRQAEQSTWGRQARLHRLPPLSVRESAEILLDLAPEAGGREDAEVLARRLDGLPLALHLAGRHLCSGFARWHSFASYQRALDREPGSVELLSPDPDSAQADDPRSTVMRTWELSLDDLARSGLPHARALLRLLSCYAPGVSISLDLLDPGHLAELFTAAHGGRAPTSARADSQLEWALRGLSRVGLIDGGDGKRGVIVHRVIRDTNLVHLLDAAGVDPSPLLVRRTAVGLIVRAIDALDCDRPEDWPRFQELTPHVKSLLDIAAGHLDDEQLAVLLGTCGRLVTAYQRSGAIASAVRVTTTALERASRLPGDHPVTLTLDHHLALLDGEVGRWAAAEAAFRRILSARQRTLGDDHPDTLATHHELARAAATLGRRAEAEAALDELLAIRRRVQGDDHPDTLRTLHDRARTVAGRGRRPEAEAAFRELLEARVRLLGTDHPDTLATRHELAWTIARQGRWAEAEAVLHDLLMARRQLLGEDHPDTLTTHHCLMSAIGRQGRWSESEAGFLEILEARLRVLGDDHPDSLATRHHLAWVAGEGGWWAEAEAMFRVVYDGRRRVLGDEHPHTLSTGHELARAAAMLGRRAEAAAALRQLIEIRQRVIGDDHPDTQETRDLLAMVDGPGDDNPSDDAGDVTAD